MVTTTMTLIFLVFSILLPLAAAQSMDLQICCLKAARSKFEEFQQYPWDMCPIGTNVTDPLDNLNPLVNQTMDWCIANCPGWQPSALADWLHPLAQWVAPYVTLLILCPIGGLREKKKVGNKKTPYGAMIFVITQVWYFFQMILEFCNLIGDPVSALWGAYSNLWLNAWLAGKLKEADPFDRELIGVVIVAGQQQLKMKERIALRNHVLSLPSEPSQTLSSSSGVENNNEKNGKGNGDLAVTNLTYTPTPGGFPVRHNPTLINNLRKELTVVLDAHVGFATSIFIPVMLTLAVTASVFYDAYQVLGDNSTAHSLAFGIFYSWLIPLTVGSAAFTGAMNAELIEHTIGRDLEPIDKRTVPLRWRYVNAARWIYLLYELDVRLSTSGFGHKGEDGLKFQAFFLFGQTVAWAAVAYACACASVISYTTPTVGLGCRSFNFLLYGIVSLLVAYTLILRNIVEQHFEKKEYHSGSLSTIDKRRLATVRYLYQFLVLCNFCILFVGTILHLVGVYTSCSCMVLFVKGDKLLDLGWNTAENVGNAKHYWLPVGYVAFSGAWLLSCFAILVKMWISRDIEVLKKKDVLLAEGVSS